MCSFLPSFLPFFTWVFFIACKLRIVLVGRHCRLCKWLLSVRLCLWQSSKPLIHGRRRRSRGFGGSWQRSCLLGWRWCGSCSSSSGSGGGSSSGWRGWSRGRGGGSACTTAIRPRMCGRGTSGSGSRSRSSSSRSRSQWLFRWWSLSFLLLLYHGRRSSRRGRYLLRFGDFGSSPQYQSNINVHIAKGRHIDRIVGNFWKLHQEALECITGKTGRPCLNLAGWCQLLEGRQQSILSELRSFPFLLCLLNFL
jgi:hypothetical protein